MEELKACPFCGRSPHSSQSRYCDGETLVGCMTETCPIGGLNHCIGISVAAWNRRTPPPHTAAMVAWAKVRIALIGELRRMEMVGFNELDEMKRLEKFVGEWS